MAPDMDLLLLTIVFISCAVLVMCKHFRKRRRQLIEIVEPLQLPGSSSALSLEDVLEECCSRDENCASIEECPPNDNEECCTRTTTPPPSYESATGVIMSERELQIALVGNPPTDSEQSLSQKASRLHRKHADRRLRMTLRRRAKRPAAGKK